jgi:hypothetical protein
VLVNSPVDQNRPAIQAGAPLGVRDPSDQTIFLRQWGTYRKVVAHNLMFHREAYALLRTTLASLGPRPLRLLDLGCGDAASIAALLPDLPIVRYDGVDISAKALELAAETLSATSCAFALHQADFASALSRWREPVDVIWIGQSLHHLRMPEKRAVFGDAHRLLTASNGTMLAVWEPTLTETEDREGWCDRFAQGRSSWAALEDAEFDSMVNHVLSSDHPETISDWLALGRKAGFESAAELPVSAWALARFYQFRCGAA